MCANVGKYVANFNIIKLQKMRFEVSDILVLISVWEVIISSWAFQNIFGIEGFNFTYMTEVNVWSVYLQEFSSSICIISWADYVSRACRSALQGLLRYFLVVKLSKIPLTSLGQASTFATSAGWAIRGALSGRERTGIRWSRKTLRGTTRSPQILGASNSFEFLKVNRKSKIFKNKIKYFQS